VTLDRERALRLLREMLRIRRFEEACVELYSATEIRGFLHLYIGQEAVAVGVTEAIEDDDNVVSTYREHGHALARGMSMESLMAEMLGKVTGCSRGRGGSMHLFDTERRFYGGHAIVGGGMAVAVGMALADHMRAEPRVTVSFFGDGAVAEGAFHESLNLAALWRLPVVFCCENNYYAMGTALARAQSNTDLTAKAASYALPAMAVDGMDVLAVAEATERAAGIARHRGGPVFLEFRTYRFRAHSMYDAELYRDKAEVEAWKQRDPIPAFMSRAAAVGVTDDDVAAIESEIAVELEAAIDAAREAPVEPVEDLTRFVYSEARSEDAA
jgi:pyruvate dehydrogenase E1 component alpha subunit